MIALQRVVREQDLLKGWSCDSPEHTLLHMQEELGEISRLILKRAGYKQGGCDEKDMNDEIADLLYLTFKLANTLEINLEQGWGRIRERYSKK
jgi:NTP pyrophosphatase (non-canonical NTP hydrolase)